MKKASYLMIILLKRLAENDIDSQRCFRGNRWNTFLEMKKQNKTGP